MKLQRIVFPMLIAALAGYGVPRDVAGGQAKAGGKGKGHALLVGVTHYPNLEERHHLKGPGNDVELMRDFLTKSFGFAPANVAVLAEHAGKDRLPTRANIVKEFERLIKTVQADDYVVIFMAGHGSQQPEGKNPRDPEPDGLDEIFLPRDVGAWDGGTGTVANAIIDDEIGAWLRTLQEKKASVWLIMDSCHSGTMIRGKGERERQLDAEKGLGVPKAALDQARAEAAKRFQAKGTMTRGGFPLLDTREKMSAAPGIVALYACQASEVTIELEQPLESKDAKPFGLFTYSIVQALTRARENIARPLTYRELMQRVHQHYVDIGRTAPTPQLEGTREERDREVLGQKAWVGRSAITLNEDKLGKLKVSAGSLHGLTEGSIFAVYPPPGQKNPDQVLGHVKVVELQMAGAVVEPCAFDKFPVKSELPQGARCELVFLDYGVNRLRIAVDEVDNHGKPTTVEEKAFLAGQIAALTKKGAALVEAAARPEQADWLLRAHEGKVFLVPTSEWLTSDKDAKPKLFGPYAKGEKLGSRLHNVFTRITRAVNLKKLCSAGGASRKVKLEMDLIRLKNNSDRVGQPLTWDSQGIALYADDLIKFRLKNASAFPVDVTVLYIDSDYCITALYPEGENNRLKPAETTSLPEDPIKVTTNTIGLENLVVIAVRGTTKEPLDFTGLAQAGVTERGKTPPRTSLSDLFQSTLFGKGGTRSLARVQAEEISLQAIPYRVIPHKRPAEK